MKELMKSAVEAGSGLKPWALRGRPFRAGGL